MQTIFGIEGVLDLLPEPIEKGVAKISQFEFNEKEDFMFNFRAVREGGDIFRMYNGKYVRLHVNGQLMMSDTGMERKSNKTFINAANGRVLIAGLGIGLIVKNILYNPCVKEIVIIEKYQDVIDIVKPIFKSSIVNIICADIFNYEMPKTEKFDTIYFDIWPEISEDNLEEMKTLHSKYRKHLNKDNPDKFMDSWMKDYLQKEKRKNSRSYSWY